MQNRRTAKPQGREGTVACPGTVRVLPWGQCIRQCLGYAGIDFITSTCRAGSGVMAPHHNDRHERCATLSS